MIKLHKQNLAHLLSIAVFFVLTAILPLSTLFLPKRSFSETENRFLADFPKLSLDTLVSDKFMTGFDDYLSDHFVGRDAWIKAKTSMELLSGKREVNGVYVLKDRLVEQVKTPDPTVANESVEAINAFAAAHPAVPVYVMIAPTAQEAYRDELPDNAPAANQKAFIDGVYAKLQGAEGVDVYNALISAKSDYIYYRNDHHWTSLGAYYAYASLIKRLGGAPVPLSSFDIEHASNDFKGTLYSKTLYDGIEPDTIDFYHYTDGVQVTGVTVETGSEVKEYDSLYFRDYLDQKDKYSAFLGNNQPVVTIRTDAQNANRLLIVKDSYAHSITPFLTQHYSEITLLDPRYFNVPYTELVHVEDYSQVLFIYNASTFMTDKNIKKLNLAQ